MMKVDSQEKILKEMINRKKQIEEKQNNKKYEEAEKLRAEYSILIFQNHPIVKSFDPFNNSSAKLEELFDKYQQGEKLPAVQVKEVLTAKEARAEIRALLEFQAAYRNITDCQVTEKQVDEYCEKHVEPKGDKFKVPQVFASDKEMYLYDLQQAQQGKLSAVCNYYTGELIYYTGKDGKLYGPDDQAFEFPGEGEYWKLFTEPKIEKQDSAANEGVSESDMILKPMALEESEPQNQANIAF